MGEYREKEGVRGSMGEEGGMVRGAQQLRLQPRSPESEKLSALCKVLMGLQ